MQQLKAQLLDVFGSSFGTYPQLLAKAPGRVNLIGEHTDYNDGFVLPMAIGCGTMVAASPRKDKRVRVHAADLGRSDEFVLDKPITPSVEEPWSNYVRGVAHALIQQGLSLVGADLAISGNVPKGAGLSSSASMEVATGLALAALAGQPDYDRTRLALAGQCAEHEFAGCNCGIMDQIVSAHGLAGHATLIDCRSLSVSPVSMPADWTVMIVHSGIERGLVDGEYNLRRQQCEDAARHYGVAALRDLGEKGLLASQDGLELAAFKRARHVVTENARVLASAGAMRNADLEMLGQLMAESHVSMRDDFAITTQKIDELVLLLQTAIGPVGGARMTGGGFGGAVIAVMPRGETERVRDHVLARYRTPTSNPPYIMVEAPAFGASLMGLS